MKRMLEGLRAVHSSRRGFGPNANYVRRGGDLADRLGNSGAAVQDSVHPVVIRHPETGRKALYVNRGFTIRFDGWTEQESQLLLRQLYNHGKRPEFTCRVRFLPGTVVFWDNRCTWHCALNDYAGDCRLMRRVTIEGTALAA